MLIKTFQFQGERSKSKRPLKHETAILLTSCILLNLQQNIMFLGSVLLVHQTEKMSTSQYVVLVIRKKELMTLFLLFPVQTSLFTKLILVLIVSYQTWEGKEKKLNFWERQNDFSQEVKVKKNRGLKGIYIVKAKVSTGSFKPILVLWVVFSRTVASDSFVTPWPVAYQALLSVGFLRQEYWSGLPFSTTGNLADLGVELESPALAGRFF